MQWISIHRGSPRTLEVRAAPDAEGGPPVGFSTGLAALDALAPGRRLARGVVHEVLCAADDAVGGGSAHAFALLLARAAAAAAASGGPGVVVWSDPRGELYPPALAAAGLCLDRLLVLRTADPADELWAVAECLACGGVAATVAAAPPRLSRVQARRLQLAAERGGGVGVLMRHAGASSAHYAAATRWLVRPTRGDEDVQRWSVRLVHGHGGRIGEGIVLEVCRDTDHVRAVDAVADRPSPAASARASA